MKKYELICVINPNLDKDRLEKEVDKIKGVIKENSSSVESIEAWGKRKIAYLAKKHREGHYVCFNFETEESDTIAKISRSLKITDNVIKYQTHRLEA